MNEELKKDLLIILNGFKQGFRYGFKVRFMHCIVMAVLFYKGSLYQRLKKVLQLTKEHSLKLGFYVSLYKIFLLILKKIFNNKVYNFHSFISGLIAGLIIFKNKSNIDVQIILYLFSRNISGISNVLIKKKLIPNKDYYPIIGAINWAVVMYLFKFDKGSLQNSLKNSMEYLYDDSEKIDNFKSLFKF